MVDKDLKDVKLGKKWFIKSKTDKIENFYTFKVDKDVRIRDEIIICRQ